MRVDQRVIEASQEGFVGDLRRVCDGLSHDAIRMAESGLVRVGLSNPGIGLLSSSSSTTIMAF